MTNPLFGARDLRCERDGRVLFEELSFAVSPGEIVQIIGPNGSGKTTLLRSICGLSSRFEGEMMWRGEPVHKVRGDFLSNLLYIGHSAGIKAALSPLDNLRWSVASRTVRDGVSLEAALDRVGLYGYEETPCYMLSAGQQRRVNLARLFLLEADLWVLDEPFTAIDKTGVSELEAWLADHVREGGSVLLTTHHELAVDVPVRHIGLGGW